MNKLEKYSRIEKCFFDIDEKQKTAYVSLHFDRASDMFDTGYISKSPLFGDEFIEKLKKVFAMIPEKYDIELTVIIDDLEDYSKQALCDIFNDNITLEYKTLRSEQKSKHRVAAGLVSLGVLFFVMMVFISAKWDEEGLLHNIFFYISDIASSILFWEAFWLLIIEKRENRSYLWGLHSRLRSIEFVRKES